MAVRLVEGGLQSFDPRQVSKTVLKPRTSGGGRGGSSRSRQNRLAAERKAKELARVKAAKEEARKKAQIQAQKLINLKAAQKEASRISILRIKLKNQKARERVIIRRDKVSRDQIKSTSLINRRTGERIFTTENLRTGEIKTRTFERSRKGARVRQTGGVKQIRQKKKDKVVKTGTLTKAQKRPLNISQKIIKLQTKSARGTLTKKEKAALVGLGFGSVLVETAEGIRQTPKIIETIVKDPGVLKAVPASIKKSGVEFGEILRVNPSLALGRIGGEVFVIATGGKVFKFLGKLTSKGVSKIANLDPRLLKIEKGVIDLTKKGGGKLTVGTIKEVKESLSTQLRRGGKRVTAVSAQADQIVGLIRRKNIIRKPLPFDEQLLTKQTRASLARFDKGKLSSRQIITLNRRLRKESRRIPGGQLKGIDLLERSTFFDPDRVIRKSRLAIKEEVVPEGSFLDLLRGEASIFKRKARPQIIVVEDIVEQLPKTKEFKSIISKLKKAKVAGKDAKLTPNEIARLTKFQVTPSGKLKPIGSTTFQAGLEREVTIAPKEAIKRVKKLGTLLVGGKRIPIIAVKIVKGKSNVKVIKKIQTLEKNLNSLSKSKSKSKTKTSKQKIEKKIIKSKKELTNLKTKKATKEVREFLKETRRARRTTRKKKRFPVGRRLRRGLARGGRAAAVVRRGLRKRPSRRARPRRTPSSRARPRRPVSRAPGRGRTSPRPRPPRGPRPRPGPRTPRGPRPPIKPGPKPPIIARPPRSKKKRKVSRKKKTRGHNVFVKPIKTLAGKKAKRFVRVNKSPLTKSKAKDVRNFVVDRSLGRTGEIRPTSKKAKKSSLRIPRGFASKSRSKFRKVRKFKGKKIPLKRGRVIERSKNLLDTRSEKKKISVRRFIKQLNAPRKRKITRTKTKSTRTKTKNISVRRSRR